MGYKTYETQLSGFTFMQAFFDRRKESSVCLKRQELLARKKSRNIEQAEWNDSEKHAFEAAWYDNQLEWIASIHRICGEPINWEQIAASAPPFPRGEKGPNEKLAEKSCLEFKPTRMQKLLKQDAAIRQELEEQLEMAREQDRQDYMQWKSVTDFAHSIREGNRTAYLRVLEEIAPLEDLLTMGSGLEFTVLNTAAVEVEMDMNSGQVIPHGSKLLTEEGIFKESPFSIEEQHELECKYVCGSVIRIARELFAVLPLDTVLVHAKDTKMNLGIGQEEYVTVLSIQFDRDALSEMDTDREASPELLAPFLHHIKFDAATGFDPALQLSYP
ncbi:hypothetical protein [Paenibacillus sp.]|jgi:hypothetical protein|uniref:hypothetical protein n=1 Tax=Paenibacillus sp. TaxID=58172 RepID=UPI00282D9B2D|nr:hypothetical protein [Paenibacillus sp.]MDR0270253.1 hypothetical protein [Paenibacillus sp.]